MCQILFGGIRVITMTRWNDATHRLNLSPIQLSLFVRRLSLKGGKWPQSDIDRIRKRTEVTWVARLGEVLNYTSRPPIGKGQFILHVSSTVLPTFSYPQLIHPLDTHHDFRDRMEMKCRSKEDPLRDEIIGDLRFNNKVNCIFSLRVVQWLTRVRR